MIDETADAVTSGVMEQVEIGGAHPRRRPRIATMLADLDLLLTTVYTSAVAVSSSRGWPSHLAPGRPPSGSS
jgi:hypothetical protein